jgi:hypothetical protein
MLDFLQNTVIISNEFESYKDGRTDTIGSYGTSNQYYELFRVIFDGGKLTQFIMMDKKLVKVSEAEGF